MNSIRRVYTIMLAFALKVCGRNVIIGKGSIVSSSASLFTGKNGRIVIGENCYIGHHAILNAYDGHITIGDNVSVNYYSVLYGHGGLTIGNNSRIATHTVVIPNEHNFDKKDILIRKQGCTKRGIHIGSDVWLAANVTVLDGSRIGDGCVIGANSVVRGHTEPYGVYVGAPIKQIKSRS